MLATGDANNSEDAATAVTTKNTGAKEYQWAAKTFWGE
jgi:hypothetical protein